ncbi:MAG TPA: hypothetical protein VFP21_09925 [Solirubrobacterales bacterium]|nr:hypothetical protein [Solirubrobacterales bacterium]
MATSEEAHAAAATAPDDANDLRGFHFKRLLLKPLTWILIGVFVLAAGVAGAALVGPALGGAAAVGAFFVALLIVFVIADSQAADAFFSAYAQQRGLALGGKAPLPPATPLLRKGDDRYADRTLSGQIADGIEGTLALYTYEEETTDSDGDRQTNYYRYTLGLVEVPECVAHVPELYCQRKFGLRSLEKFEDVFLTRKERVNLDSEELDKKYEIFSSKEQDAVWLRRLFSPTFIVWLNEAAPPKFAFELVDGALCCYVNGHKENAADLDAIAAATGAVAKRLRDEAAETSRPPEPDPPMGPHTTSEAG